MRELLTYLLIFNVTIGLSQDRQFLNASYTPGFLLAHRADIINLGSHNYGLELSLEKNSSNSSWGKHYRKPSVGYGILYYNLGRVETGHAVGAFTHVKLNICELGKSDLRFRMAAGLAYLSKKFDPYTNRRNQAIGSHFNGNMQFGLIGHTPIRGDRDYIEYGLSISHYSNAAFKVPNLGYNIPSITLRYGFGLAKLRENKQREETAYKSIDWRATVIYGKKQRNFGNEVNFYNFGFQLRGLKNVSDVKAWRFGLDYFVDKTYKYSEDRFYPLDSISLKDKSEIAIAGGFQWGFGKVDVVAEIGAYLYKPAVLKNPISQRMGLNYEINEHWNAQGTLRFHRGVADFFEMGIGYTL